MKPTPSLPLSHSLSLFITHADQLQLYLFKDVAVQLEMKIS